MTSKVITKDKTIRVRISSTKGAEYSDVLLLPEEVKNICKQSEYLATIFKECGKDESTVIDISIFEDDVKKAKLVLNSLTHENCFCLNKEDMYLARLSAKWILPSFVKYFHEYINGELQILLNKNHDLQIFSNSYKKGSFEEKLFKFETFDSYRLSLGKCSFSRDYDGVWTSNGGFIIKQSANLRHCEVSKGGVTYCFKYYIPPEDITKFAAIVNAILSHEVYQQQSLIKNKDDLVTIFREHEELVPAIKDILHFDTH
jgi:hypothetical protein